MARYLAELAPVLSATAKRRGAHRHVVLACTHYPLLLDRLVRLAPWPVDWIDPAPAIARRVADLLGPPGDEADRCRRRNDFHLGTAAHAEPRR